MHHILALCLLLVLLISASSSAWAQEYDLDEDEVMLDGYDEDAMLAIVVRASEVLLFRHKPQRETS